MQTALVAGNQPEVNWCRVYNADTVVLPYGSPVYMTFTSGTPVNGDGVAVKRPSAAGSTAIMVGLVRNPAGIAPGQYGDVNTFGYMLNVPVIANTRATTGTAYSTQAAIATGAGLTVDATNNFLTGITLITKSQSNIAPAILIDAIGANQGNGTTPATLLYIAIKSRIFIPRF